MMIISSDFGMVVHAQKKNVSGEKWSSDHDGWSEVVLPDKTRADCVTSTHTVEFNFGTKWAESLGGLCADPFKLGGRAGIVLVLEEPSDIKFFRLKRMVEHFNLSIDTRGIFD